MPLPFLRPRASMAGGPAPPPPPPPPSGPNWDFVTDSPVTITGPGTATIHWGIVIFEHTGAVTSDIGFSGTESADLPNGGSDRGLVFATLSDDNGSSGGALFWSVSSNPV